MSRSRFALLVAALALAVVAEWSAYRPGDDRSLLIADGVVGFVLLGSAVVAWKRHPESRVGPLMGLTGLTWFAGNFWPFLVFLHRGPLVHLHLSYPTGRLRWRLAVATVAASYVIATIEPLAHNDTLTLALAVLVAGVAAMGFLRTSGTARRAAVPALAAALAFAGVLALGALNRLAGWDAGREVLWAYDLVVVGAVIVLLVDLLRARWADDVVTELVVDLGSRSDTGTLRDALGRALGDPSLMLGYWLSDEARYVDDAGSPVEVAQTGRDRVVTPIERDGRPVAVLVHDVAVLDDPGLVDAVATAARFAVSNARLQAETRERVIELGASRDVGSSTPATRNVNASSGTCATGSSNGSRRWPGCSPPSTWTSTHRPLHCSTGSTRSSAERGLSSTTWPEAFTPAPSPTTASPRR